MKKYLFVIALLALVIFASGCTQNSLTSSSSNSYSVGGISFNYPEGWVVTSITRGNQSVVSITDAQAAQSNGTQGDTIIIEKAPKSTNRTLETIANQIKQSSTNATNGTVNIAGLSANQFTQAGTSQNGAQVELEQIYFEKNSMIYVVRLIAIGNTIQSQQQYFDVVINSLKVQ